MSDCLNYVLITPARNEETFIEKTIESVISQSVIPAKWIIVSDGSTDRTEEIVGDYAKRYAWILLICRPGQQGRNFASKVMAFNAGYNRIADVNYDIVGNLDADITFESDYIEYLLGKFVNEPMLGVAGTPFIEDGDTSYDYRLANIEHVSGACQLFRKKCFDEIGGYMPIRGGGIDWVAVTTARMKGWQTRTFTEKTCFHHRKMGTGKGNVFSAKFRLGREDYYLGSHPFWALLRAVYQMKYKPYALGGSLIMLGYLTSAIMRKERPISKELISFYRREQMQRLRNIISKAIGI